MRRKRFPLMLVLSVLIIMLMLVGVTGCAGDTDDDDDDDGEDVDELVYPEPGKDITWVCGYAPGGAADPYTRITAKYLGKYLDTEIIVENIPGAGNLVATSEVAGRPADGYTILWSSAIDGFNTHYHFSPAPPPWTPDDWQMVTIMSSGPSIGIITLYDTYAGFVEFIEDVRARPGEVKVAFLGPGRVDDLWVQDFKEYLDAEFNLIWYDSSASVQADLLTGDLDVGAVMTSRKDFIDHPDFRVMVFMGAKDVPEGYPYGVPGMGEFADALGYDADNIGALGNTVSILGPAVRAEVPMEIVRKLEAALEQVYNDPEWKEEFIGFAWPHGWANYEEANRLHEEWGKTLSSYPEVVTRTWF